MRDPQVRILLVALLCGLCLTSILLLISDPGVPERPGDGRLQAEGDNGALAGKDQVPAQSAPFGAADDDAPQQAAGEDAPALRESTGAADSRVYRGSLLSADSLHPMAGFEYEVTSGDKLLLTGEADSVGQFEFRVSAIRNPVLQAVPPAGYRIIFPPLRLADLDDIECQEIELFVRLERSGPLKGKLISDQSQLPLPYAWVSIEDELGSVSEFTSDHTGWMKFEQELAGGVLKVTPLGPDGKPQGRTNLVDFQGLGYPEEMLSLPVDAGPVIRLELVGPSHLLFGPLEARIFPVQSDGSEWRTDLDILQLPALPVSRQIPAHWNLPLGTDAQYGWIQVSGQLESMLAQTGLLRGSATLEVSAPGSMYVGLRELSLVTGTLPPDPLRVELLPTASIRGRVTDENGAPMAGATISVDAHRLHITQSDENGWYLLDNLPIDPVGHSRHPLTIRAYAQQTAIYDKAVFLKPGREHELHWQLTTLATKPYPFVVYSQSPDVPLPTQLQITHADRSDWEFRPFIELSDPRLWDARHLGSPEIVGTFELRLFEDVQALVSQLNFLDLSPDGTETTWQLDQQSDDAFFIRGKRARSYRTPCDRLSTKKQRTQRTDIHVRAISADTGRPIPEFTGYAFQGAKKGVSIHSKQVSLFPDTRFQLSKCDEEPLLMGISAAGYAPALITQAQLYDLESPSPFARAGLDCLLHRGWGAIIQVYQTSTTSMKTWRIQGDLFAAFLQDLSVLVDGQPVHYEVVQDFLVVSRSAPPKSLELQRPGWGTSIVLQAEGPLHLAVFSEESEPRKRRLSSPLERFERSYSVAGFNAIPKELFDTLYTAIAHFSELQGVEEYEW